MALRPRRGNQHARDRPGRVRRALLPVLGRPGAGPFARPDIDTRPIRSEQGLTFAEMLAVNANPDAGGGTFLTQPWLRRRKRSDFKPRVHVSFSADDCPDGSRAETRTKSFFLPRYERSASRSRNLVADDIYTYLSTTLRRRRRRRRTRVRQTQSRRDAWRAPGARARFVPLGSPLGSASRAPLRDGREGRRTSRVSRTSRARAADAYTEKRYEQIVRPDDDGRSHVDDSDDSPLPFFVDPDRGVPSTRADARSRRASRARSVSQTRARTRPRGGRTCWTCASRTSSGGHIRGSVNVWDPVEMHRHLLRLLAKQQHLSCETNASRDACVFVCDAIGDRATRAFRYVRGLDRNDHIASTPR